MRSLVIALCVTGLSFACAAAPAGGHSSAPAGRWIGIARIPGEELRLVIDLDQDASGAWIGSITLPDLNIKGAPLAKFEIRDSTMHFAIRDALGEAPDEATFTGDLRGTDHIDGTFTQAGNHAPFSLQRTGPPQVDLPPMSTAVDPALAGTWQGDYELGGYARHVTLGFTNHPGSAATVEFVIVGKQRHVLPVDLVSEEEGLVRVESHELETRFEGRREPQTDGLKGTVAHGSLEAPIVLRRVAPGAS